MDIYSPISNIMTPSPITIGKKEPLKKVKELMEKNKFHHLPVVENGKTEGMISRSDLLLFMKKKFVPYDDIVERTRLNAFHVEDIMTTGVAKLAPTDHIATALFLFKENIFHAAPVVENDKLVGIITTFDIINALLKREDQSHS